ncbi:glycosyltransferase 87 family protein [Pontibacter liquoris]|uniref:glycosyltransferase 87 family protein n=1 Tax=Pontibacter liquoris TaxID=2905677 RepID=UPI001FA7D1F0|nr:glycosyltransferase 87 family protein [Pontibacter liquoris]
MKPLKSNLLPYILLLLSAVAYVALGYATQRTSFTQLLLLYGFCFGAYVYLINQKLPLWLGLGAAILFRILLLLALPALSENFYRYVWDGRLLAAGINPYLYLPAQLSRPLPAGLTENLVQQLPSAQVYSTYLPVPQAVFWLGARLFPANLLGSVVVIRCVLLLAEVGSLLLLLRLLRKMALPEKYLLLYALNPLVILELTGNLHLEALLIFFLLLALLQLFHRRLVLAGIAFGLAVGVKLLPLLFLPFILRRLDLKRFMLFGGVMLVTVLALYYPLATAGMAQHQLQSIQAYFHHNAFNASVYYMLRWLGFRLAGYDLAGSLAPLLAAVTLGAVLSMASVKRLGSTQRLMGYMAAALAVYFFLAPSVYPWHLTTLLALTVVSHFRFAVVWSGLAILAYAAYRSPAHQEDVLLLTLEYMTVLLWLVVELYLYRKRRQHANLAT